MLACQEVSPVTRVTMDRLAAWIWIVEETYWHDLDGWTNVHEHVEDVLDYFGVPYEWKAVVRTMAQGCHYYGEDTWYAKHVDPSQRKDWMEEYWEQN
jgi:hypothetical protein